MNWKSELEQLRKSTDEVRTLRFLLVPKGWGGCRGGGQIRIFFVPSAWADSGAIRDTSEDCVLTNCSFFFFCFFCVTRFFSKLFRKDTGLTKYLRPGVCWNACFLKVLEKRVHRLKSCVPFSKTFRKNEVFLCVAFFSKQFRKNEGLTKYSNPGVCWHVFF